MTTLDPGLIRRVRRAVKQLGWRLDRTGKNHWRITRPDGAFCTGSSTPSCRWGKRKFEADLRRLRLDL